MKRVWVWIRQLPGWIKGVTLIASGVAAVFVAGIQFGQLFEAQVVLPATVSRTVERVDVLEHQMADAQEQIAVISQNSLRLRQLNAKIDSIVVQMGIRDDLALGTYCVSWAHARGLDIGTECTLIAPSIWQLRLNGGS